VLLYPLSMVCMSVSCPCSSAGNIPSVLPATLFSFSGMDVCSCGDWGGSG